MELLENLGPVDAVEGVSEIKLQKVKGFYGTRVEKMLDAAEDEFGCS